MFDFNHYKIGKNKIPQIPTKKNGKGAPPHCRLLKSDPLSRPLSLYINELAFVHFLCQLKGARKEHE